MSKPKLELIKLSASSMKSYEQCPRKYYFNYIQRAPKKEWAHFDLGNLCHKALEIFHEIYANDGLRKYKTLPALMSHSFKIARSGFPKMDDVLLTEAKELLADYLKAVKTNGMPVIKGVETSFEFNIREDILVRGFLDRIDVMKDGQFRIVDYKTNKNPKYLDEFQLLLYGSWLKRQFPHIETFKGAYVLLRHQSKLKEYDFNMDDVERVENKIIEYADKIKTEDQWVPIPSILCNWCDFKEICPAHQEQKESW